MVRFGIVTSCVANVLAISIAIAAVPTASITLPDGTLVFPDHRIWHPATGEWRVLEGLTPGPATLAIEPDGRVRASDPSGSVVVAPPYLFDAVGAPARRPAIHAAPATLDHSARFWLDTRSQLPIARVTLVSAATGNGDWPLAFTPFADVIYVAAPAPGEAPSGRYLLFVVDSSGVPSTAAHVELAPAAASTTSRVRPAAAPEEPPPQKRQPPLPDPGPPVWSAGSGSTSGGTPGGVDVNQTLEPVLGGEAKHQDGHSHGCTTGHTADPTLPLLVLLAAAAMAARRARVDTRNKHRERHGLSA